MNENLLLLEPHIGLGFFKLESSINYILSEIRSRGDRYENIDVIVGESTAEPIFIILNKEGIKLRFDQNFQRLELIEIDSKYLKERTHPIYYKNSMLISGQNNDYTNDNSNNLLKILTYNYINNLFGPTNMPKLIDSNKFLLLRYDGLSFLFENHDKLESCDQFFTGSELFLSKICIFAEKNLVNSISKENLNFKFPLPLIKVELDKGIIISTYLNEFNESNFEIPTKVSSQSTEININFDNTLEDVLHKLQNPNYVYYKSNNNGDDLDFLNYNKNLKCEESNDFFLNYYSYGLDILIDAVTHKVKKFVLHTNNPYDDKFGVYNICNFSIELNKNFFKKINEIYKLNENENLHNNLNMNIYTPSRKTRKFSDDYQFNTKFPLEEYGNSSNHNDSINVSQTNLENYPSFLKIEKTDNINFINSKECHSSGGNCNLDNYNIKESKENLGKDDAYNSNNYNNLSNSTLQYTKSRRENRKTSIDKEEKSFSSMNESSISISLNTSDICLNISITPSTNFLEILNRIPPNSYVLYHNHEPKLNIIKKYYAFDGIIFEVLENHSISTVTLIK